MTDTTVVVIGGGYAGAVEANSLAIVGRARGGRIQLSPQ